METPFPNANGVASLSPGLAEARGLPWVHRPSAPSNRKAVVANLIFRDASITPDR
jgi:hypothetical protein